MKVKKIIFYVMFILALNFIFSDNLEVKAVESVNVETGRIIARKLPKKKKKKSNKKRKKKYNKKNKNVKRKKIEEKSQIKAIKSVEEFNKIFSEHLNNFDERFIMYVDANAIKYEDLWDIVCENTDYKDLRPYITENKSVISGSEQSKYIKLEGYFKFSVSKEDYERAKANIIRSDEEFNRQFMEHVNNIDKDFVLDLGREICPVMTEGNIKKYTDIVENSLDFANVLNGSGVNYSYLACGMYIRLEIRYETDITKEDMEIYHNFIRDWVAGNISDNLSDEEKVRKIYEYIASNYEYSFGDNGKEWFYLSEENAHSAKLGKYSIYSSLAMVFKKAGVCSAYARLFYALAKEAGIEVLYIDGTAGEPGDEDLHAWNMVKVDRKWYHIDSTWANNSYFGSKDINWDFYLKSDSTMEDYRHLHKWDKGAYPNADEDYGETSYYYEIGA